jgi:hypothetical protein
MKKQIVLVLHVLYIYFEAILKMPSISQSVDGQPRSFLLFMKCFSLSCLQATQDNVLYFDPFTFSDSGKTSSI